MVGAGIARRSIAPAWKRSGSASCTRRPPAKWRRTRSWRKLGCQVPSLWPIGGPLLARLGKGDTLIIAKLDRGFRNAADALATAEMLKARKVDLVVADMGSEPVTQNGVSRASHEPSGTPLRLAQRTTPLATMISSRRNVRSPIREVQVCTARGSASRPAGCGRAPTC